MRNKHIAIVIDGAFDDKKGLVNTTLTKINYLRKLSNYDIDVFSIQTYYGFFTRLISNKTKKEKIKEIVIDNIHINLFWINFSIINYVLSVKFNLPIIVNRNYYKKVSHYFSKYDLISCHSLECSEVGFFAKKRYGIPFVASWYGSDIHTAPIRSSDIMRRTKRIIESADWNFFVSADLKEQSDMITRFGKKDLLYFGVRDGFRIFPQSEREKLRLKNGIKGKVVSFSGGLVEVKNPQLLPEIYKKVKDRYSGIIDFWITGNGKMREYLERRCKELGLNVKFWGYVSDEVMPCLLNCVDVLVIPSRNEGLPLITLEALACGANVVGANVGGIREAIGDENVFNHGDNFISNISNRIVHMLDSRVVQKLPTCFEWFDTTLHEIDVYNSIMKEY